MELSSFNESIKQLQDIEYALNASSIVAITDKKGNILHVNDQFCTISRYEKEELIGQNHRILKSDFHDKAFFRTMWKTIANGEIWHGEIKNKRKDGTYYWVDTTIVPFLDETGKPYQYISIRHDITALKEMKAKMKQIAYFDSLTSLPNQNYFTKWVNQPFACKPYSVFFIDIDRFKYINDHLGHQIGDSLLKELAHRLKNILKEEHFLCRKGGDEFVFVLEKEEELLLQEIKKAVSTPFCIGDEDVFLTASIGVCHETISKEHTMEMLVKYANHAMLEAKTTEGTSVSFYDTKKHEELENAFLMEEEIKTALERNEFQLVFQPLVTLENQKIIGAETLLRWHSPKLGNISPFYFIPLLEKSGLMTRVGNWVLEQALLQMKMWQEHGLVLEKIAVNVSPIQFNHPSFIEDVHTLLQKTNVDPSCLELEITESTILNKQKALDTLLSLKNIGVHLSIDDFGTGYSSLSYLKHLPIDTLKIDKSFLDDLDNDGKVIVNTIISMAKHLEFTVIAEGVEEKEQVQYLQLQDCHIGQGYYFGKPMDAQTFQQFIEKDS